MCFQITKNGEHSSLGGALEKLVEVRGFVSLSLAAHQDLLRLASHTMLTAGSISSPIGHRVVAASLQYCWCFPLLFPCFFVLCVGQASGSLRHKYVEPRHLAKQYTCIAWHRPTAKVTKPSAYLDSFAHSHARNET